MIKIKQIHLNTLTDEKLKAKILNLVVKQPGWTAQRVFKEVFEQGSSHYISIDILLLFVKRTPVAWNARVSGRKFLDSQELWAYTAPKWRQRGFQRILILESRKLWGKKLMTTNHWLPAARNTFAYLRK